MKYSAKDLEPRRYTRSTKAGDIHCIDLRSEEFGHLAERFGRKTLYDPSTPGWPLGRGRGTTDPELAAEWLESYATWITNELWGARAKANGLLLTKDGACGATRRS